MQIIYHLSKYEAVRYNELQLMLDNVTCKTLSTTEKEMINDGIIDREEYHQIPPKIEYSLMKKSYAPEYNQPSK